MANKVTLATKETVAKKVTLATKGTVASATDKGHFRIRQWQRSYRATGVEPGARPYKSGTTLTCVCSHRRSTVTNERSGICFFQPGPVILAQGSRPRLTVEFKGPRIRDNASVCSPARAVSFGCVAPWQRCTCCIKTEASPFKNNATYRGEVLHHLVVDLNEQIANADRIRGVSRTVGYKVAGNKPTARSP